MTPLDIRHRVHKLRGHVSDPEAFHSEEDKLWIDVLEDIAAGKSSDPRLCAKAVLRSREIPGRRRWYA